MLAGEKLDVHGNLRQPLRRLLLQAVQGVNDEIHPVSQRCSGSGGAKQYVELIITSPSNGYQNDYSM